MQGLTVRKEVLHGSRKTPKNFLTNFLTNGITIMYSM